MENTKMEVKINNMEYTIVSDEQEEYVQRVALLVNKKISEVKAGSAGLSTAMLSILASMNLADELLKSESSVNNLRNEISVYMDEVQASRAELDEKKLEVETLKEEMHKLEIELAKRETELENLKTVHSQQRQSGVAQQSAVSRTQENAAQDRASRYGSNVIGRGVPRSTGGKS